MISQMPNNSCPNIKTEILELRSKIGEMKSLKTILLSGDSIYLDYLNNFQVDLNRSFELIEYRLDAVANEEILSKIKKTNRYAQIGYFYEGRAKARVSNGDWCHIDYSGNPSYDTTYYEVDDFYEGTALVEIMPTNFIKEYCHIDKQGQPLYPNRFKEARAFMNGKAVVRDFDDNQFYIDLDGNRIPD
jgi:hypothetical protein